MSRSGVIVKTGTQTLAHKRDAQSANGVHTKSHTPGRRKTNIKRERTPEEDSTQSIEDNGSPSQASVAIPRNALKLKRLETK